MGRGIVNSVGGWVAIELTTEGDLRASDGTLERMIRRDLGVSKDHPVFIPVKRSALAEKHVVVSAMDGYVFVGSGLPSNRYFALERRSYVEQVLCRPSGSGRIPHIIKDAELLPLRGQMEKVDKPSSLRRGAKVEVSEGMLASLQGTILDLYDNSASVRFDTRTLVRILAMPLGMLKFVENLPAAAAVPASVPVQQAFPLAAPVKNDRAGAGHRRRKELERRRKPGRAPAKKMPPRIQLGFKFR